MGVDAGVALGGGPAKATMRYRTEAILLLLWRPKEDDPECHNQAECYRIEWIV